MTEIRRVNGSRDRGLITSIDTSFETDAIFDVRVDGRRFELVERPVEPRLRKTFSLSDVGEGREWQNAWLALEEGKAVGVVATQLETWNRRVIVRHLYVDAGCRRRGVGRLLLETALHAALDAGAQTAWLETSNLNVPGVRAYERLGFAVCGLDTTLYDGTRAEGEVALFLARPLASSGP